MQSRSGNFLLQTLLALALVFAFMPFFVSHLSQGDDDAKMYAASRQIELAQTAARIYVRENLNNLPYNTTTISGDAFTDMLEPYGLPLGFVPQTALGQNISLVVGKNYENITAYLRVAGGDLTDVQRAELARRIGFYATVTSDSVLVGLALNGVYSDVVHRNSVEMVDTSFLTDLNMDEFNLDNVGTVLGQNAEFKSATIGTLAITGVEDKIKNSIKSLTTDRVVFQSQTGEAPLSVVRGTMKTRSLSARTISKYGNTGSFTSADAAMYNFALTAGHTSFVGPEKWTVHGNLLTSKITLNVDRLDVSSYINASRGQDVYIDSDSLDYSAQSGMSVGDLTIANITMRDQTSNALLQGGSGGTILDIRPGGTSLLPDVLVLGINNDDIYVINRASADNNNTVSCKSIIESLGGKYYTNSLSDYIVCQYIYWVRLEQRIDIKQCLLNGGSNCD